MHNNNRFSCWQHHSPALAGSHQLHLAHSLVASSQCRSAIQYLDSVMSVSIVFLYYPVNVTLHLAETWAQLWRWAATDGTPIVPGTNQRRIRINAKAQPQCIGPLSYVQSSCFVSIVSAAQSVGHGGSAEANAKGVRYVCLCRGYQRSGLTSKLDPMPLHWNGAMRGVW